MPIGNPGVCPKFPVSPSPGNISEVEAPGNPAEVPKGKGIHRDFQWGGVKSVYR